MILACLLGAGLIPMNVPPFLENRPEPVLVLEPMEPEILAENMPEEPSDICLDYEGGPVIAGWIE